MKTYKGLKVPEKIQKNKLIIWLFSKIYSKWLWCYKYEGHPPERRKILAVLGWRTMRINDWHGIQTITPCFLWFK